MLQSRVAIKFGLGGMRSDAFTFIISELLYIVLLRKKEEYDVTDSCPLTDLLTECNLSEQNVFIIDNNHSRGLN